MLYWLHGHFEFVSVNKLVCLVMVNVQRHDPVEPRRANWIGSPVYGARAVLLRVDNHTRVTRAIDGGGVDVVRLVSGVLRLRLISLVMVKARVGVAVRVIVVDEAAIGEHHRIGLVENARGVEVLLLMVRRQVVVIRRWMLHTNWTGEVLGRV